MLVKINKSSKTKTKTKPTLLDKNQFNVKTQKQKANIKVKEKKNHFSDTVHFDKISLKKISDKRYKEKGKVQSLSLKKNKRNEEDKEDKEIQELIKEKEKLENRNKDKTPNPFSQLQPNSFKEQHYQPISSRGWSFTLNNPTNNELVTIQSLHTLNNLKLQYLCYGKEIGELKATPHLQGYFFLAQRLSLSRVKTYLPRAHLEPSKGSPYDNIRYCQKQGQFFEFGVRPTPGKRSDLRDSLHMTNDQIRTRWPGMADRLIHNRNKIREEQYKGFHSEKEVIYISGPSGSGKTKKAYELAGSDPDLVSIYNTFVVGYSNEGKPVILDEFRDSQCDPELFLKLCDKYSNVVNVKGSEAIFYTPKLIITSIIPSRKLYHHWGLWKDEDVQTQIQRRITQELDLSSLTQNQSQSQPLSGFVTGSQPTNPISQSSQTDKNNPDNDHFST